jgi:Armadillo/beta-catenin-like repeat
MDYFCSVLMISLLSAGACWALSYLTGRPNKLIQEVMDAEVVPSLVGLLERKEVSVVIPALRTIGNILNGNDAQTVCDVGQLLLALAKLIGHPDYKICGKYIN